jgi:hypothetical protein
MDAKQFLDRSFGTTANQPIHQPPTEKYLSDKIAEATKHRLKTITHDDDFEMIARVKHTMQPNEHLGEWYSRVSLGRAQAMDMTREQITAFVAQSALRENDFHAEHFKPAPMPQHFVID